MYRICKKFEFSAGHALRTLPEDNPCYHNHGHNYLIELELEAEDGTLDDHGFIIDARELDCFKRWLDAEYDHQMIYISAELLARECFNKAHSMGFPVSAVRVHETPKFWAEYRR